MESDPTLAVEPRKEKVSFRAEFERDDDREELEARIDRLERLLESGNGNGGSRETTKRTTTKRATRPASAKRATGSRGGNAQER